MATHNALGKAGEDAAAAYLERNGYAIRHRNWRKNHLELDIVATKDNEVVIVEVKTRSNTRVHRAPRRRRPAENTPDRHSRRCLHEAFLY